MPVPYGYTAVRVIKEAILRSQYRAASAANKKQLSLSKNSCEGFWGKGAFDSISRQLQTVLPHTKLQTQCQRN